MVEIPETVYVYLDKNHQRTVYCVHCRAKISLAMAHHKAHLGSNALQVCCPTCRRFFYVFFEYRRHHRTPSAFPGKLFLYNVPDEGDTITVTSLSASGVGFTTTQHCPTPGERYEVLLFLDDKHRTMIMEEILICWVAGRTVGAEFYMHATTQQTLAVACSPMRYRRTGSVITPWYLVGDEPEGTTGFPEKRRKIWNMASQEQRTENIR